MCFCSSVLSSDKVHIPLIEHEIINELLELALHGRRTMELRGQKAATIGDDPYWPASQQPKTDLNLYNAFGSIIHSREINLNWEDVELEPNPYKGRKAIFAASVTVISDHKKHTLPVGAIAASYFGIQNQFTGRKLKGKA